MTVVEFIRARLDEDEAAARAATPGTWELVIHRASPAQMRRWRAGSALLGGPASDVVGVEVLPAIEMEGNGDGGVGSIEDGAHIARWDPARVLADIQAKRTILADYENTEALYDRDREAPDAVAALRAVIHHMAAPYAGHPDYDPSWSTP